MDKRTRKMMYRRGRPIRKYRVKSPWKFALAIILLLIPIFCIYMVASSNAPTHAEKTTYTKDEVAILIDAEKSKHEKLVTQIEEVKVEKEVINDKYRNAVVSRGQFDRHMYELYKNYEYALTAAKSDITIDYLRMLKEISASVSTDPNLMHLWLALIELESQFDSNAKAKTSTAKCWGQVLDTTAKDVWEKQAYLNNGIGTYDSKTMGYNKTIHSKISMKYLASLISQYGVEKGLINYNGGEIGQRYVRIVANNLRKNAGLALTDIHHSNP